MGSYNGFQLGYGNYFCIDILVLLNSFSICMGMEYDNQNKL